jgi:RHS repeat-associated protein
MTLTQRSLLALAVASLFAIPASAQVATGTPPFGSYGGGPDVINLANLNSHITIPVLHKPGRGQNFNLDLAFDSSVWTPVTSGSSKFWTPATNFGWTGTFLYLGVVLSSTTIQTGVCGPFTHLQQTTTTTYHWSFQDGWGAVHPFAYTSSVIINPCTGNSTTGFNNRVAYDGSGYSLSANGSSVTLLTASNGTVINTNIGVGSVQDRNGNQISFNGATFTDTLGTVALSLAGSRTPASPWTLTYTAPSGANATYTVRYSALTVQTAFACSGVTEFGPTTKNLITEIDLPDISVNPTSKYSFTYEQTPGVPANVTGRLASVTLPTGGTISYSYSGGSNGIVCADGSAATLTRTTPDGTWTYAHSESGTAWTTLITDPQNNQTNMNFQGIYETQRQVYQGTTGGTLLRQWTTCYNGNSTNCNGTAITLPITQRTVTDQYGTSGLQCRHNYLYNSVGGLTEQDDYNYGSGAPGALLRQTLVTFASLNNITAFRQQVTVKNGAGTTVAQTNYNYDETTPTATSGIAQHTSITGSRGNLTSINYPVSGLTSHFTYYDTGSPNTSQDINLATTTYNYSSTNNAYCQMAFPTSISEPLGLSRSMTWNCTGGVQLTATDENSQTMTTSYSDPYYWRPASVTDPLNNSTTFYYQPNPTYCCPSEVASFLTFNNGNSVVSDLQYEDGLGRTYVDQHLQSPGSSTLDSVSYAFDSNGRPYSVSVPCAIGYAGTCSTPKTTQTYDALNRPLVTTDGGGGTLTYAYPQNDVLVTIGPAPSGENTKRRQLEYDSLGRLTSVCELTSLSGSGTCGQTNSQTGYWTKYTYDAIGDLLTVTQNAQAASGGQQTRTYNYDAMNRLTSEVNPENGTTTYTYDTIASGTCASTFKGDLIKRLDAIGNATCYTYDVLHRPLTIAYTTTGTTVATPTKNFVYDSATVATATMQYAKTRLAEAYTTSTSCTSKCTDEGFSYTVRGELTDFYEFTPHSPTSYYHVSQTYWPNGAPNLLSGNATVGIPNITYGVDGEGRASTISANSGPNPVTSTTYNIFNAPNQLTVALGSGDSDVFTFDPNTLRQTKYQFNIGSQTVTGTTGWNQNGSLGTWNITDPFSTANTQNCAFTADDLSRINQVNCGTIWGQTFSYDPFGNIQKTQTADSGTSFTPTYASSPITNRVATVNGTSATYDANGNSLNDTFRTFTWDANNNTASIGPVTLTYDAFDRMVEQSISGTNSEIVYSPVGVKLALMNGTTLIKAFVPLTGGATAVYNSSGLAYYRHTDHLGSSRFASTPTQTLYSDTAYSPYGEPYASSGAIDNSFTGQNQETTAGLYDFLFREQDPNQTRWTQSDPAGIAAVNPANPQSWNRYAYVLGDPLSYVDPLGFGPCKPGDQRPSCHGPACMNVYAGCVGGPSCFAAYMGASCTNPLSWYDGLAGLPAITGYVCGSGQDCSGAAGAPGSMGWLPVFGVAIFPSGDAGGTSGNTSGLLGGSTARIGPGDPNAKMNYCSDQSNQAALEEALPGITRGQYVSTAAKVGGETAAHLGLDGAAASSVLKRGIRARFGVPMSVTEKVLGRVAVALLVFSAYEVLSAAQEEYKACMAN